MNSRDFAYWLQGFFEIWSLNEKNEPSLNQEQITCIKNHLDMVFAHEIDPSMGDEKHQEELNKIHQGQPKIDNQAPLFNNINSSDIHYANDMANPNRLIKC